MTLKPRQRDDEAREWREQYQRREAEREASQRKCRCRKPLPGRVYLGVPLCHLCQRLMEDR